MWDFEENDSIWRELDDIVSEPSIFKPYFLTGTTLHTQEKDLDEDHGVMVASMNVKRDYKESTTDTILIDLFIDIGTYVYDVYPFADDLELTLTRFKQKRSGAEATEHKVTYKALFRLDLNTDLPTAPAGPREVLNKNPPVVLTLELVDKGSLAIRNKTTQGIFNDKASEMNKDMSASSILKSVISRVANTVKIDGQAVLDRVMIEESQNKSPLKNLILPTGTSALNVANYIQEECGGIYTAGCNNYIQYYSEYEDEVPLRTMFVYSLYDGDKFESSERKMLLYIPPTGDYNVVDKTFSYRSNVLKFFSNPVSGLKSTKDAVVRSTGDGFKTASAEDMMKSFVEMKKEGLFFKKSKILTEITSKLRDDGITYIPYKGISSNHFVNTTEILSMKGQYLNVVIDNLDIDFIYPGAVKIMYEVVDGLISEMVGVIHNVDVKYDYVTFDPSDEKTKKLHGLVTKTFMTIYVTGPDKEDN